MRSTSPAADTMSPKTAFFWPVFSVAGRWPCGSVCAPQSFAGVLSIGGCFPRELAPLSHLQAIQRLPLFIAQGRESRLYPMNVACDELRLFHAAGLRVMLRQYPCGDDLTTQMLHDMDLWMMERINGVLPDSPPCHSLVLPCEEN
jgi:hypothetical protein